MELTQEYFDQQLAKLAGKQDIAQVRQDIKDAVEELARVTNAGLEEVKGQLDVREEVGRLKGDVLKIKQALHLS
jgi:hypothetical protein